MMFDSAGRVGNGPQQARGPAGTLQQSSEPTQSAKPAITLPKGGGAIRGMGEKFAANPVTGTGSLSVPIFASPGRAGFGPQLALAYDSGAGNGPFGFGWTLSIPAISRKTDKGLPQYRDAEESDVFILSGAEDLVPVLIKQGNDWVRKTVPDRSLNGKTYRIQLFRPRIEGLFARIERWTNIGDPADSFWRSISKDNITTWYGKTAESRISAPDHPERSFTWLICESYDDKGNAVFYQYVEEDSTGIDLSQANERNRMYTANRYVKRIKYGNRTPRQPDENLVLRTNWMFEVVLDYGEHYAEDPQGQPTLVSLQGTPGRAWSQRKDPFSTYRAGFEVRTCRLCRRVLMFHHFPTELGTPDCLVRATHFHYDEQPIASFITSVEQSGYVRQTGDTFLKRSLPPLEFHYTKADISDAVQEVDSDSVENLPAGLATPGYELLDLDGEGAPGILTQQGGGWFYKRNLSPLTFESDEGGHAQAKARFAPVEVVARQPGQANGGEGRHQFLDLAGDGQLDLVDFSGPVPGFYERTQDEDWESFRPFASLPNLRWNDPNLKFIDLTGDGHADILVTEDEVFVWHPSLAENGFAPAERVRQPLDEERGPRLVFADGTQSIYVADMSGDGLTDIVRIRNGEVCYWPNLGYGRFGAKVTMDDAPWFDFPDQFDQQRVRLADIDGSGVTDILYIGSDGVRLYFNHSGNGWSDSEPVRSFPGVDNLSAVQVIDLLGNGTACLVWSSPLPGDARRPMRYVDLMGGQKPHLRELGNVSKGTLILLRFA